MRHLLASLQLCGLVLLAAAGLAAAPAQTPRLALLFLGDNGHHRPAERFRQLQPVLAARGIDLTYTDKLADLNPAMLKKYDGLVVYANATKIEPEQEQALLDFVAGGKGFIPLHCASYCFLNSPKYIELVGAQFQKHGSGVFRTVIAAPDHPVMKGFRGFESWDETYVHTKHNEKDRTVLEYREDKGVREPWTWVRTHGQGRVFYTAWGHDERTWGNPGFQNLIERGIRWAVGIDATGTPAQDEAPKMTTPAQDVKPFQYVEANVPFYAPGGKGKGAGGRQMQLPLAPAESMKHMVHPADFDLQLVADESHLGGKPLCMNWDERGRLWVAVTVDYPNELQPEGKGRDRIVIVDPGAAGKAGKVTVFADKLSIPTSLTFARGGVIVHQAPHTLFLKDTNGDDIADERTVLFTGWSTGDTHAGPSNLQYGLDNWLWGIVGYAGFNGSVGGEKHTFRQGFYRFQPDGKKLEFLRSTNNNSWGVGLSEEGLIFGSTANGNPSVYLPIPNRYYEMVRGWSSTVLGGIAGSPRMELATDKVRQVDWHGQFTAAAGHALYTARTYPRAYWNRTAFVTEPTGHIVATFVLQPSGANFTSCNAWNLLASADEWTAPTMAEVGPDGNVWVIDWYNYIVQHNPTPAGFKNGKGNAYETPLRDKKHGRIYRLVHKQSAPAPALSLQDAALEKLVAALKNDNMFWRKHAQRLLVERGQADVVPALIAVVQDQSVDAIGLNPGAIHALWTLHGLGQLDGQHARATAAALGALKHPSAGVRRNALLVLPRQEASVAALLPLLHDGDAQVRLAAFLALAEMPAHPDAGAAIAAALGKPENSGDRWIADAATSAAAAHAVGFLSASAGGQEPLPARVNEVLAVVAEHYARGGPADSIAGVLAAFAAAEPKRAGTFVAGLAKGWPAGQRVELKGEAELALTKLLTRIDTAGRGQLLKLATAWGSAAFAKQSGEITRTLTATLGNEKEADEARLTAARQLIEFNATDAPTVEKVLAAVTAQASPALAAGLVDAVGGSQAHGIGALLVERLAGLAPGARAAAVRVLVSRPEGTKALLDGIEAGKAQIADLTLEQRQALTVHPDRAIAGRVKKLLERGGGLPSADREKVIQELLPVTMQSGDPALGKELFKKHCISCHTHSGEGNKVGPDLTGMAAHPKAELLIHLLDPSRSVEGNYRIYTVLTTDGRLLSGLLASETRTSIEMIDAEAKRFTLQRDNVAELVASAKSLMPEGFEKQMKPAELVNLLEFLTQRGKFLPLPLHQAATIVSTQGMFHGKEVEGERLVLSDWSARTVEGVPFQLVDPQGDRVPNVILLHGPQGKLPPRMPKSATLPCNTPAKAIHLLSGVSGWGYPLGEKGSVSLIVRLHYADGQTEDHALKNGEHFADYIRRVDVPQSKFAFALRGQQMRFLTVVPARAESIKQIELRKGPDRSAPVVMAVTVETR